MTWRSIATLLFLTGLVWPANPLDHSARSAALAQADSAPCGYADGFDLPVPGIDIERTDFAIYRARFGGLHTGIDVAFEQLGEPVRAAARGQVTFSDPQGWDTEKGVVVVQHTLPDGTLVNTLYGHMEELNGHVFPPMGQCVERGDIVGAIGFPSRGRPHLHYEVRTRYRHEGGPGYTAQNPLELGWLHPVDFTYLANLWVHPAYRWHFTLADRLTLAPLPLEDGTYVVVSSAHVQAVTAGGAAIWQFDTLGSVTGLLALPDGRVLVATSADQVIVLAGGRLSALWAPPKMLTPPILLDGAVVFMTAAGRLAAFTPDGAPLWETEPLGERAVRWAVSGDRLAVATPDNALTVVDSAGAVLTRRAFEALPVPVAAGEGAFWVLAGMAVGRLDTALAWSTAFETGRTFSVGADLVTGPEGVLYAYSGEGRVLHAWGPDGVARWIAFMPGSHLRPPLLGIGDGALLYALSTDGQLLAFDTGDGRLIAQLSLYDGGVQGTSAARWLAVGPDDSLRFSSGFLTVVGLDGTALRAAISASTP
ncbi:MAG: peptidoglycan DD-metalloendopeptidase family protein [Anaerolineae bacterium]|nr:peptidoglycan DD-metalloendopeptidase family protein [Anaerolineae bacterium]